MLPPVSTATGPNPRKNGKTGGQFGPMGVALRAAGERRGQFQQQSQRLA